MYNLYTLCITNEKGTFDLSTFNADGVVRSKPCFKQMFKVNCVKV